ncbi:ImmA/IrrE family metallo-endopeptidase [Kitasatospora sp. NPDC006697]|uniref:ImmA/IrrE family metallo-endopeptidase n=1 Tax=Kitasatospora sp. NPDC006697 TaxID=3364020 RepID=UPI0036ADCBEA
MRNRHLIEAKAEGLLQELGIHAAPVPVDRVAHHLGARIHLRPFDSRDVSGMLFREDGKPPIIGVNALNGEKRQRFTIAHEIAHLVLHPGKPLILDRQVKVNFRDATSSTATDEEEMQANAFAAALLMPKFLVAERLHHHLERDAHVADVDIVKRIAADFDVSIQAMEYRLTNLGLLSPA